MEAGVREREDRRYAITNQYSFAAIRNRAGRWVLPSVDTGKAALEAEADELIRDCTAPIVDAPGVHSYPICGLTYVILPQTGRPSADRAARFWSWAMQPEQQAEAGKRDYVPLPRQLAQRNIAALAPTSISITPTASKEM